TEQMPSLLLSAKQRGHVSRSLFSYTVPPPPELYTLSLHDALPISTLTLRARVVTSTAEAAPYLQGMEAGWTQTLERLETHLTKRSEEHTSELQSRENLVCRLLLEKKNKRTGRTRPTQRTRPPASTR